VSVHERPLGEVTAAERYFTMAGEEEACRDWGGLDPLLRLPSTDQQSGHPAASTIRATTVITALFCAAR
jgi:hypothetical protein